MGINLTSNCISQWRMNDDAPSSTITDRMGTRDLTYAQYISGVGYGSINTEDGSRTHATSLTNLNTYLVFPAITVYHSPYPSLYFQGVPCCLAPSPGSFPAYRIYSPDNEHN